MLISELAKTLKEKGNLNLHFRHGKFKQDEYVVFVDAEYPNFFSPDIGGELIEWYPSLEDLMAEDWEIIQD